MNRQEIELIIEVSKIADYAIKACEEDLNQDGLWGKEQATIEQVKYLMYKKLKELNESAKENSK